MQDLPHHYQVKAVTASGSNVTLTSPNLASLETAAPAEFGGPGDLWSPETLLTGAVANCFILSFKAIARASKLEWSQLDCDVEGVLERVEKTLKFTEMRLNVSLAIPATTDSARARLLLEKAEKSCLITNSMTSSMTLDIDIQQSA